MYINQLKVWFAFGAGRSLRIEVHNYLEQVRCMYQFKMIAFGKAAVLV